MHNLYDIRYHEIQSGKVLSSQQPGHLKLKYRRLNKREENNDSTKFDTHIRQNTEKDSEENSDSDDELLHENISSEDEVSSADDDEKALILELERIRRSNQANVSKDETVNLLGSELQKNPLLEDEFESESEVKDFTLKKRWTDDVVFSNQSKREKKVKKRFINDTVRSDFHKQFLKKYIV
ncbi:hypothetical protein cand_022700 [Cryptosporidium andersoni]|uniref:Pre-mRNA-splicing factor CWC15 n=1 Tax=Cryptosporidium andersoni TaxID=117008 RepID=A0A1J4MS82_9CRYT|nr:hypothetical protein cand_022700 [Cryptosporidium andersoni]